MTRRIVPSPPGIAFSMADLGRAQLSIDTVSRMIAPAVAQQGMPGQEIDATTLLAAILKATLLKATRYTIYPFFLPSNQMVQVLNENPKRTALIVGLNTAGKNNDSDVSRYVNIAFDQTSAGLGQIAEIQPDLYLSSMTIRAAQSPGPFVFEIAPTNAITLIRDNLDDDNLPAMGIIMEGT